MSVLEATGTNKPPLIGQRDANQSVSKDDAQCQMHLSQKFKGSNPKAGKDFLSKSLLNIATHIALKADNLFVRYFLLNPCELSLLCLKLHDYI